MYAAAMVCVILIILQRLITSPGDRSRASPLLGNWRLRRVLPILLPDVSVRAARPLGFERRAGIRAGPHYGLNLLKKQVFSAKFRKPYSTF
jgi:hypothetical protein